MNNTGKIPKAARAAPTAAYLAGPRTVCIVPARCTCSQYPNAHDAHVEEKPIFDYHSSLSYKSEIVKDEMQRKNRAGSQRRNLLPATLRSRRKP